MNAVKHKLAAGGVVFGTMIKETLNIGIVDVLEIAGYDYFVIDMEHARYDMVHIADLLQYARKSTLTGIVRVPELNYAYVAKALDMGAEGIWTPHVDSEAEARELVACGKYPPEGRRGSAVPTFRQREYQQAESPAAYFQDCNAEVLLIAQIESAQAVADVEKIAAVTGIDVCMMGTNDLSLDMGFPGQGNHPKLKAAVQCVVDACKNCGKASGNHIADIDMLRYWMEQGMRMITYTYPSTMVIDRSREVLKILKAGLIR